MRFAVAHKTASYLMVAFAYLAMTGGGGVPGPFMLGGILALVVSWWWEPPRIRYERWSLVWTIANSFALVYALLSSIVTGDFLGVGAQFLMWLIVSKAFNRRAARDWQQMYLLAFLMLVAGSVLNPELSYGLCFLGFVITTTWAMTLFHLRREMEDNMLVKHAADRTSEVDVKRILDSRRIVGGRFFAGTGALSFAVFLGAAAVFLALPRVGIGFFLKSRGGLTLAGFQDGVKLGGHGVIKDDPTVIMRVEIDRKWGGREAPEIHWRGVAFDDYSKGQWRRSKRAPSTRGQAQQVDASVDRRYPPWGGPHVTPADVPALEASTVQQDIYLEPLDSDVLFGAGQPRILQYEHVLRPRTAPPSEVNDELRLAHGSTVHYTVWSSMRPPPIEALRAAPPGPLPRGYDVYLELGPEITPRTRALAAKLTANRTNNYDKAAAIQGWLEANLDYTLELADPGDQEPVDFFLFDRKKGHCEYFASAFAVLARAAGIPVRNVNGFLGGEWNEYKGYVAVRAGDAHSWDEVYFPGQGWVTFDPTPPANIDQLGRGGSGWRARLGRFVDTLRFQWTKWVIEYDLASQLALFKSIGRAIKSAAVAAKDAVVTAKNWLVVHWPVGLAILALPAWLILRRRRGTPEAMVAGRAARRRRSTVAETYDQVAKALAKAGVIREAHVTPRELATRMSQRADPGADAVGELTELYYSAEWGGRSDPAAEARAQELLNEVRTALVSAKRQRASH